MGEAAVRGLGTEEIRGDDEHVGGGVRWERFLPPRVYVRVLLVEADDSTRQIIAALLRKCSYRVAAAADGRKAWEMLKEKSQDIDLVLTDVELPCISGYGLLTMIMEHETCKNIPVIMMSSHYSLSIVFKYMLKGAADFLIKPIRKNELRNLWQHVWRRHLSDGLARGTYEHQVENLTQEKHEAKLKNNASSKHYEDLVSSKQNRGCSEKGYDSQSSSMRRHIDDESECMQNMQKDVQPDFLNSSIVNSMGKHKDDVRINFDKKLPMNGSRSEGCTYIHHEEKGEKFCQGNSSSEVDLIRGTHNNSWYNHELKSCSELQSDISSDVEILDDVNDQKCSPLLELTLRTHQSISTDNWQNDELNMINHSNSSAFSRYTRAVPSSPSTSNSFRRTELIDYLSDACQTSTDKGIFCNYTSHCNSTPLRNMYIGDADSQIIDLPNQHGRVPCSYLGPFPVPVPITGTAYNGLFSSHGPLVQSVCYTQSGTTLLGVPTFCEATRSTMLNQSDQETSSSGQHGNPHDQDVQKQFYQMKEDQLCNIESLKENSYISSVAGHSESDGILNGTRGHINSSACGSVCDPSNGNLTSSTVSRSTVESTDGNGFCARDKIKQADFHCSIQREAALKRFRSKRKERSYEKKVRYQSKKRVAEEHLRVESQFFLRGAA